MDTAKHEAVELHKLFFGKTLADVDGRPVVDCMQREFAFGGGPTFTVYAIAAAVVDNRGRRTKKQWGPDDITYDLYPELRQLVPRCYSEVGVWDAAQQHYERVGRVKGMPKFTGLNTDEEDDSFTPNRKTTQHMCNRGKIKSATHFLVTTKANGKSCVVSAFNYSGHLYFVLGSKNVHVVVDSDLTKIHENIPEKNVLVRSMATVIAKHLEKVKAAGKYQELVDILLTHTLCGEFEDGEHIIPREGDPDISWFALLPHAGVAVNQDRNAALTFIRSFGLPTVEFHLHPKANLMEQLIKLRCTPHMEGAVIDFMVPTAGNGAFTVLETVKFKSVWYVLTRSVREIMRGALSAKRMSAESVSNDERLDKIMQRVEKTLHTRSSDFLHLSEQTLAAYTALYRKYIAWFIQKGATGADLATQGMAHFWAMFLKETGTSDVIEETQVDAAAIVGDLESPPERTSVGAVILQQPQPQQQPRQQPQSQTHSQSQSSPPAGKQKSRVLILTHGIPGDGKTSRGTLIAEGLTKLGHKTVLIEQDQFAGDRNKTQEAFQKLIRDQSVHGIILSRCNSCLKQYVWYLNAARSNGLCVLGLIPDEIMHPNMLLVCISSILNRKNHVTMAEKDEQSQAQYIAALMSFRAVFLQPRVPTDVNAVLRFKSLHDFQAEPSAIGFVNSYLAEARTRPFQVNTRSLNEVRSHTLCDNVDYGQFRLPIADICADLIPRIAEQLARLNHGGSAPAEQSPTPRLPNFYALPVPASLKERLKALADELASSHTASLVQSVPHAPLHTPRGQTTSTLPSWRGGARAHHICTEVVRATRDVDTQEQLRQPTRGARASSGGAARGRPHHRPHRFRCHQ
eukprot:TRINITY_DN4589_c0_g1_i1.p1 TRINITY_DN4589_c0_g1~~TRINITY_DN4589_c0_g1_i1.p1  ORF type:complete len:853 (-),score=179.00 TRINITY_DN4589_c0_g1_i1:301-2859(-)